MKPAAQQIAEREAARTDRRFAISRETIDTPEDLAHWIDGVTFRGNSISSIFNAIRHFEPTDAELGAAIRLLAKWHS